MFRFWVSKLIVGNLFLFDRKNYYAGLTLSPSESETGSVKELVHPAGIKNSPGIVATGELFIDPFYVLNILCQKLHLKEVTGLSDF